MATWAGRPPCGSRPGGHEVAIVDNFSRRRWVSDGGGDSLTPILDLEQRIEAWHEVSGERDPLLRRRGRGRRLPRRGRRRDPPRGVIHYGQQASAPYSMLSRERAVETQHANVIGNLNLLFAIRDHVPECHLVKLGTMGEYGQPNIDIEEGYIEIEHKGRKDTLPFPKLPARSTTARRSTTRPTSTSPAAPGACAPPT
jgi:UDP-sulfoquinovose synthase